jgi:hypothetical protein
MEKDLRNFVVVDLQRECQHLGLRSHPSAFRRYQETPRSLIKSAIFSKIVEQKQSNVDGLYAYRPDLAIRPCLTRLVSRDRDHSGTESGAGYEEALEFDLGWRNTPMAS